MDRLTGCLAWICLTWYGVMTVISLTGVLVARKRYRLERPTTYTDDDLPAVSILRPLRGLDCNLYDNLEASFQQDYPKSRLEIIFSVASADDRAIPIVKELMEKHPEVDAKLIIGEEVVGVNPKINNLIQSYRSAKHDILWVLDSNTLVSSATLRASAPLLVPPSSQRSASKQPIGLVHHVPFAILPSDKLGSRVEQAFLNGTHARMYIAINYFEIDSCLTGKSNLFRRSVLEEATASLLRRQGERSPQSEYGALEVYGRYLGEDNMIGRTLWHELGMRHIMTHDVAGNVVGEMDLSSYFWRRVRWIRVRKYMVTASTLAEPFTESLLLDFLTCLAVHHLFAFPRPAVFFVLLLLSFALDVSVSNSLTCASPNPLAQHVVAHDGPSFGSLAFLRAWLVREALALPIWAYAMCSDRVGWRNGDEQYRVTRSGEVEIVGEHELEAWTERWLLYIAPKFGKAGRRKGYAPLTTQTA